MCTAIAFELFCKGFAVFSGMFGFVAPIVICVFAIKAITDWYENRERYRK